MKCQHDYLNSEHTTVRTVAPRLYGMNADVLFGHRLMALTQNGETHRQVSRNLGEGCTSGQWCNDKPCKPNLGGGESTGGTFRRLGHKTGDIKSDSTTAKNIGIRTKILAIGGQKNQGFYSRCR